MPSELIHWVYVVYCVPLVTTTESITRATKCTIDTNMPAAELAFGGSGRQVYRAMIRINRGAKFFGWSSMCLYISVCPSAPTRSSLYAGTLEKEKKRRFSIVRL